MNRSELLAAARRLRRRIQEGPAPKPPASAQDVQTVREVRRKRFEELTAEQRARPSATAAFRVNH